MNKSPLVVALASAFSLAVTCTATAQMEPVPPSGVTTHESFMELDGDLDGKITQQEADKSQVLKDRFATADTNGDGGVDASEFSAFIATSDTGQAGAGQAGATQPQGSGQISFETLDVNSDGWLSQSEAQVHPTLSQNYASADQNSDGYVSRSEFSAFESGETMQPPGTMQQQQPPPDTGAQQPGASAGQPMEQQGLAFDQLDVDKDGYVSQGEAQAHPTLSQQYTSADQDQDGKVSQSEFSAFEAAQPAQPAQPVQPVQPPPSTGGMQPSGAFDQLDSNRDGYLSSAEVQGQPQITQQFTQIDSNKDGWLSRQEYTMAMGGAAGTTQPQASSFQSLDTDKDGSISLMEARIDPILSSHFTSLDKDRNGLLDQSEFGAFESAKQQQQQQQ